MPIEIEFLKASERSLQWRSDVAKIVTLYEEDFKAMGAKLVKVVVENTIED